MTHLRGYIATSTRPTITKFCRVLNWGDVLPLTNLDVPFNTWSCEIKTFHFCFNKTDTAQWWHRLRGLPSHLSLWSCGHVISRNKIKTLCLHFRKTYKHLVFRISSHMYIWSCVHLMLHEKNKNVISPFSQDLNHGLPFTKSSVPLIMWPRYGSWKNKNFIYSLRQDLSQYLSQDLSLTKLHAPLNFRSHAVTWQSKNAIFSFAEDL